MAIGTRISMATRAAVANKVILFTEFPSFYLTLSSYTACTYYYPIYDNRIEGAGASVLEVVLCSTGFSELPVRVPATAVYMMTKG
jgi:hypothetical protein